jgi:hypothetical protein
MQEMRVVYFWHNGCYVNTLDDEFDAAYAEMSAAFGFPEFATVRGEEDWDVGSRRKDNEYVDGQDQASAARCW